MLMCCGKLFKTRVGNCCVVTRFGERLAAVYHDSVCMSAPYNNKKAQLSLTNPRDACEKFARFT